MEAINHCLGRILIMSLGKVHINNLIPLGRQLKDFANVFLLRNEVNCFTFWSFSIKLEIFKTKQLEINIKCFNT